MAINYTILQGIPEQNRKIYTKILKDAVLHPKKYRHIMNVPGTFDCKEILKEMGYKFKELYN